MSKRSSSSIGDKNESKRQRDADTDMPIYLMLVNWEKYEENIPKYEWLVIEDKQTPSLVDGELLKEDEWLLKSEHDRVRHLKLPHLDYQLFNAAFFASKSRLFFLGGYTTSPDFYTSTVENGILSVDLLDKDGDLCWKRCGKWDRQLEKAHKVGIYRRDKEEVDDDWICVLMPGEEILNLDCRDPDIGGKVVPIPQSFPDNFYTTSLLGCTNDKMLLFTPGKLENRRNRGSMNSQIRWFDMKSMSYELLCVPPERVIFDRYRSQPNISVVVEQFVISFLNMCPYQETYGCYWPRLYVYDTKLGKWLIEPVQGLPNDGVILPIVIDVDNATQHEALFQVRKEERKFALIWSGQEDFKVRGCTDIHWSKFNLNIEDPSCIRAENVSSGVCLGGDICLSKSAVG